MTSKPSPRRSLLHSTMLSGVALLAMTSGPVGLLIAPTPVVAQDLTSGTLSGTVTDTGGAPIQGATVTVTQNGRTQSRTLTTDAAGAFRAAQIPIGTYSVSITAPGYETYTDSNVAVSLGRTAAFSFAIGTVDGSVSSPHRVVQVDS